MSEHLAAMVYNNNSKFYHVKYSGNVGNVEMPATHLLHCMECLARADNYQCRVLGIVRYISQQINQMLTNGDQRDKEGVKYLLDSLSHHSCEKCRGDLTVTTLLTRHGLSLRPSPAPARAKQHKSPGTSGAVPAAAIQATPGGAAVATSTGIDCKYYTACRGYLGSLDTAGMLYCITCKIVSKPN